MWGPCSKTCGKGTQIRARLCNNPPPSLDGTFCEGQDTQSQICNIRHCPGKKKCIIVYFQLFLCVVSISTKIYNIVGLIIHG